MVCAFWFLASIFLGLFFREIYPFLLKMAELDWMGFAIRCSKFGTTFGTNAFWNTVYNTIVEDFFRFCSKFGYRTCICITVGVALNLRSLLSLSLKQKLKTLIGYQSWEKRRSRGGDHICSAFDWDSGYVIYLFNLSLSLSVSLFAFLFSLSCSVF